jgi:hypothetical protein
MTLPVEMTVHRPILMLVGVTSFPDCDGVERVGCKSPRNCTSAMITVRPPSVMFAVPVIAERLETLLPESCYLYVSKACNPIKKIESRL